MREKTILNAFIFLAFCSNTKAQINIGIPYSIGPNLPQIMLWQNNMPDAVALNSAEKISPLGSVTNIGQPRLIVHLPKQPNGTAVLIISGGGYAHIELGLESTPAANWLQSQNVTAFELIYRLPQEGGQSVNVPFEDAQRAMKIIRSKAREFGLDTNKIGTMGFSAGAHLAGFTAALPAKKWYRPVDATDSVSATVNFAGLMYPVLTMLPPYNTTHAKKMLLGVHPNISEATAFSVPEQVTATMPKCFLAQAADDPIAPLENSLLMFAALRQQKIASEMHLFQSGGHGWGMGKPGSEVATWPALFKQWCMQNGFWK